MRFEITGHIYEQNDYLKAAAIRFELDADSEELAHEFALYRLRTDYPQAASVSVTAKEL